MMKKWYRWFSLVLLTMTLSACRFFNSEVSNTQSPSPHAKQSSAAPQPYLETSTPTFYVHGYNGSANSTNSLIYTAQQQAGSNSILRVTVAKDGRLHYSGSWEKHAINPLVQIVFSNNSAPYDTQAAWLKAVIQQTAAKYPFKTYQIVAHSAGNVAAVDMLMTPNLPANFPKITKFVSIAGCYNGVITIDDVANQNYFMPDGLPAYQRAAYQLLDSKRQNFPKGVHILNIMGDLKNGSHSDGLVSEVSARSLKVLIRGHQADYTELVYTGSAAQHSRLHENKAVATRVDQYLWGNPANQN